MIEGWLLDIYTDGDDLVFWIKMPDGDARSLRLRYPPSFYVAASKDRIEDLEKRLEEGGD